MLFPDRQRSKTKQLVIRKVSAHTSETSGRVGKQLPLQMNPRFILHPYNRAKTGAAELNERMKIHNHVNIQRETFKVFNNKCFRESVFKAKGTLNYVYNI